MSETWKATRDGYLKLKTSLAEADEDTRYSFAFWIFGLATMAAAIILQFGWPGFIFCGGFVIWKTAKF